jgi:predicted ATP-grasp superfamily ATP-dependent carboligase
MLSINSSIIWSDLSLEKDTQTQAVRQYQDVEKINNEELLNSYILFFEKQKEDIKKQIDEFFSSHSLEHMKYEQYDEKKLFEIENKFAEDEKTVRTDFKELFAQYVVVQIKNKNKELKMTLHSNPQNENEILKNIEENRKLIHTISENNCQFINNMV